MNKTMSEVLSEFVESSVRLMVDYPNDVKINVSTTTKSVIIQIEANPEDYGKIIGKKGNTISSLKTLAIAIKNTRFEKDYRTVFVEVIEDENNSFYKNRRNNNF